VNAVIRDNAAFSGMEVSAHYQYFVVPGVVVYDLRTIGLRQTPIDVHTAFLEFAKKSATSATNASICPTEARRSSRSTARRSASSGTSTRTQFRLRALHVPRLFQRVGAPTPAAASSTSDRDALLQFHRQWYGMTT